MLISHIKLVENQTGKKVKIVRSDNGTEYICHTLEKYFSDHGIQHQKTIPYTPQQNGVAERFNRSIVEKAKCLLFDANLPKCYWAEAMNMAMYLMNRCLSSVHGKIPYELFHNKRINLSNLKLFGTEVMVMIPKEKRKKFDKNSKLMWFIGYDNNTKGYRCTDKNNRSIEICRNVKFLANSDSVRVTPECMQQILYEEHDVDNEVADETIDNTSESGDWLTSDETTVVGDGAPNDSTVRQLQNITADDPTDDTFVPEGENGIMNSTPKPMTTRSKGSGDVLPLWFANVAILSDQNFAFRCDGEDHASDPVNLNDVTGRSDEEKWRKAMEEELSSLNENNTWELTSLPKDKRTVKTKWVFRTKRDRDGNVVRYKARLVAKGFSQRYGIDYDETYAPVVRYTSVRLLMALAASKGLKIHQMDAVTAFLQGEIEEDIYLEQPDGFNDGTGKVCKLKRAIYGLKQAGRQWNKKLDRELKNIGLIQSDMDPCIYHLTNLNLMVAIYVDDFLIFYKDEEQLKALMAVLCSRFRMKDMGPAKGCIGIRIKQTDKGIELDQQVYVEEILKRFGMIDSKPIGNPCDINSKLINETSGNIVVPYQQAIGCLLFLAQATRPDLAYAVHNVSRFNNNHGEAHWQAVKRIFRYLKATVGYKLVYCNGTELDLVGWTDADWASDIDGRKSVTGYVFIMSSGAISWRSTKQQSVALSSTEAEYMALAATVQEAIWLKQLCGELGIVLQHDQLPIYCDNQSAIKLAESAGFRPRTKHIDIRYHFLREQVERKNVMVKFVDTNKNIADVLTKPVTKEKLDYCSRNMGCL